jgi:hypothetical protein
VRVRKHSKFSASGAERWEGCPGSVELSEGLPDKDSPWSIEGTTAHAVLEAELNYDCWPPGVGGNVTPEMHHHAADAARFIRDTWEATESQLLVEHRVHARILHPDAFGTLDSAVVEHFGTLHVVDYKYGAGVAVSAAGSMQMAFYAIALADQYQWNFKRIRMWIIQPRIKGYDGPTFWEITASELKDVWVPRFQRAVARVLAEPDTYVEGSWCHWCKAKTICPLKTGKKLEKAKQMFSPIGGESGVEEKGSQTKSEAEWRKEKARRPKARHNADFY